jgi:UDP-glucose 4-epimerase
MLRIGKWMSAYETLGGMTGMRILITGGAGFIGSHTTDLLAVSGHKVTVYDNLSTGSLANLAMSRHRVDVVEGDVRDLKRLAGLTRERKFDAILHLAAMASVTQSRRFPRWTQDVNVGGALNVLEVARKYDVKRVVLASSAAVYGNLDKVPSSEDHPVQPLSHYGVHKLMAELYAQSYAHLYGLETVCLRYFNVYGPRQQAASIYTGVITKFVHTLFQDGISQIDGDGRQTRDFIYVHDVASANIAALVRDKLSGAVINVGSGHSTSVLELYNMLCRLLGKDRLPTFGPPRPGDIRHSRADVRRMKRMLTDRAPSTLEIGLGLTIKSLVEEARRTQEPIVEVDGVIPRLAPVGA